MATAPRTLVSRLLSGALLTAALLIGGAASATPTVIGVTRTVTIGDNDATPETHLGPNSPSAALSGPFNDSVSATLGDASPELVSATQNTNIGPGGFSGSGHAEVGFSVLETDGVFARSLMDVVFTLSAAHNYSLTGLLDANMDGGLGFGRIRLSGGAVPIVLSFAAQGFTNTPVADSGVLGIGNYHLTVEANISNGGQTRPGAFMGGTTDFSFDLALREITVPEPASLALFGLGLAGLGVVRRRRG